MYLFFWSVYLLRRFIRIYGDSTIYPRYTTLRIVCQILIQLNYHSDALAFLSGMLKETSLACYSPISKSQQIFQVGTLHCTNVPQNLEKVTNLKQIKKKKTKYIYMPAIHHALKIRIEVEKERKARQSENLQKAIFVIRMSWAVYRSQKEGRYANVWT